MFELAILYFGIALINALYFLSGKKNNVVALLSCAFYILFVIGKRYDGSFIAWDLGNYQVSYSDWADKQTVEIGYKFLCIFANSFKLQFETFYMLLAATYLTAIFYFTKKIGGNLHLVLVAVMLYFVLVHFDQLRNQCAFAIMLMMVFPISGQFNKKRIITAYGGLLLASLFHISFIFYFLPLFMCFRYKTKTAWIFLATMIVLVILVKATSSIGVLDTIIQNFIASSDYTSERYEKYTESNANLSFLAPLSIYTVLLCALIYWNKYIIHNKYSRPLKKNVDSDLIVNFLLFASVFVLLTTVNSVMYRYVRDVSFLIIIYLGINSAGKLSLFKNRLVIFSATIAVCVGWFVFDIFLKGYWLDYLTHFFINDIIEL